MQDKSALTEEDVLRIAKQESERRGWSWREPTEVHKLLDGWEVISGAASRGAGRKSFLLDEDGNILDIHYNPR